MRASSSVLLDAAWATQLGVTKTSGVYRISRHQLIAKLAGEHPGVRTARALLDEQDWVRTVPSDRGSKERLVA